MPTYYEGNLALTYYCADLDRIPRLTREEETMLVERLRLARSQPLPPKLVTQTKHRLVEGNQRLVLFLALKHVRTFARLDLEDLVQEGNLALLEATERCAFLHGTFSGYASVIVRGAFSKAHAQDWPVSITRDILQDLYQRDAIRNNTLLHAYSLDTPLRGSNDLTLADTLAASDSPPSSDTTEKTTLVEGLLAGLTERQRQVLSLRYGLDEADRHEHSLAEIAAQLGMTESGVCDTLKKALGACRRLAAKQNLPQHKQPSARHCYQPPRTERMTRKRLEQFAKLQEAEQTLRERGERITGKRLAALAHVDDRVGREYVRAHPDPAYEALLQAREQQRLEDAYATLQAQGQPVTLDRLVQLTSVGIKQASAFLNAKAGNDRERLTRAYVQLQTQGFKTIGRKRLAQAAQVSQHRAELFLREQMVENSHS
jgi:RNA polymerase sigma factor (sigma-70 family)